jgi:hypothetical protein
LLVFIGGALYRPSNYDALTYRLPRVLHWLAQEQWHWIHTANYRMNDRSCGFEWLTAPVVLATGSDRALFLINFISFLLLPGLVFSVFTRLGVRRRVAWHWMWLLPTGYNFLLQAGSIGNDSFAAVDALAASLMGFDPWDMEFLHLAQARGMGSMDSTRADAHRKAHLWMGVRGRASAWLNWRKVAGGENRTRYRVPGAGRPLGGAGRGGGSSAVRWRSSRVRNTSWASTARDFWSCRTTRATRSSRSSSSSRPRRNYWGQTYSLRIFPWRIVRNE